VLAFHYGGDADALHRAKTSVTIVLHILHNLFDCEVEKEDFTPTDLEAHAKKMYDKPPSIEVIKRGLYLVQEFRVLSACSNPQQTEVLSVRISDNIVTLTDIDGAWDAFVSQHSKYVESDPEPIANAYEQEIAMKSNSRDVFVVHGHDDAVKESVARFLEKLNLNPIILHEKPNQGRTVIEKFEAHSDVGFAVVLLTPDDVGGLASSPDVGARRK
jgi:hypothetical protein